MKRKFKNEVSLKTKGNRILSLVLWGFLCSSFIGFGQEGPGAIDESFYLGGFDNDVYCTALQPDGKILVGGRFTSYNHVSAKSIIRLNADGTIDNSFVIGSAFNNAVNKMVLQPDGKIVLGGRFDIYNDTLAAHLIRLNPNGSIDVTFSVGEGFDNYIYALDIQPDGKIVAGGWFTTFQGEPHNKIVRLNTDGSLDESFDTGTGISQHWVYSVTVQPDGKILVGGQILDYNGTSIKNIVRINPDGSKDNSFNPPVFDAEVKNTLVQPDGKIIVVGLFSYYHSPSGNTVWGIARLNSDGSIDQSFNVGLGFDDSGSGEAIALQSDGKILVGGYFTKYNHVTRSKFLRLNSDGTLDTGFETGYGFSGENVLSITVQSDDKIIVGGSVTGYNGMYIGRLVRLVGGESLPSTTGVDDLSNSINKVYPNPANTLLNISVSENTNIKIVTVLGAVVSTQQLHTGENSIDVSNLVNGIYFIQDTNGGAVKFIKE